MASCGGIFRDDKVDLVGCNFAAYIVALHAELVVAIMSIEYASLKGWNNFRLKSDSHLVINACGVCISI